MLGATIAVCPRCQPPVVRRLDGSRITGWSPQALFVGYLVLPKRSGTPRPPLTCPECGSTLERRSTSTSGKAVGDV